jgi:hypothetical protein
MLAPPDKKPEKLRGGRWYEEEEAYAERLLQDFIAGALPIQDGTLLRTFLAQCLLCDPMRISKKYAARMSMRRLAYKNKKPCAEVTQQRTQEMIHLHDSFHAAVVAAEQTAASDKAAKATKRKRVNFS